jgi:hypothetical protein
MDQPAEGPIVDRYYLRFEPDGKALSPFLASLEDLDSPLPGRIRRFNTYTPTSSGGRRYSPALVTAGTRTRSRPLSYYTARHLGETRTMFDDSAPETEKS